MNNPMGGRLSSLLAGAGRGLNYLRKISLDVEVYWIY